MIADRYRSRSFCFQYTDDQILVKKKVVLMALINLINYYHFLRRCKNNRHFVTTLVSDGLL